MDVWEGGGVDVDPCCKEKSESYTYTDTKRW